MNRIKKIVTTAAAVVTPFAMFAQEATAPNLGTVTSGATTLFYGAAALGVAILVYRIGRKALTKGV